MTNYWKHEYVVCLQFCCAAGRFTHCTVEGLSPSHDYQFRVIAENFYGRSDPCEPSSLIQTVTEQEGRHKKGLGDTDGRFTFLLVVNLNLFQLICGLRRRCRSGATWSKL